MTDDVQQIVADIEHQERELQFDSFDEDDAWRLGCLITDMARARRLPVAVDILRNGHQLFHAALPGATADNDAWIHRKAATVNRFAASSLLVALRMESSGTALDESFGVDPLEYAAAGGSFPLRIRRVGVVGAITVSGLPQLEDHALVVEAIQAFLVGDASDGGVGVGIASD